MIPQVIDMEETSGRGKDKAKIFHIRFQFCYESSKIFNKKVSDYFLVFILKKHENCDNKIVHCATREKKTYFASVKFDARAKRG